MRIDLYLTENGFAGSRAKAQSLIIEGLVFVNGKKVNKPSQNVLGGEKIEITQHREYVSRGARKLLGGIDAFGIDFSNRIVLDVGASTGGFTQVALEHDAKRVYAVDVGKNQLDKTLRDDDRVVSLEEQDIRTLDFEQVKDVDIIVGDLSFISLTKVLPHLKEMFGNVEMCLLFKPQFECGKSIASKYTGIIKDKKLHLNLIKDFVENVKLFGFEMSNVAPSPILGGDGNREYLVYLNGKVANFDIEKVVNDAFKDKI